MARSSKSPKPPKTYDEFVARYPALGDAWAALAAAGASGPLDPETARLVKLGIAVGAGSEGAIRASARKAVAMGISKDAIVQVVALAAGTIGLPATVAAHSWLSSVLGPAPRRRKG